MEKYLQNIQGKILCRDTVVKQLYSLIGYPDEPMPMSIFIYGHVATGKSLVVENLLSYLKYNVSIINCIEHMNGKHMFNYILADLSSSGTDFATSLKSHHRCDNFVDFLYALKAIAANDPRPIVIVFDKCERLRDLDSNILPAFLRLGELSNLNVCTLFLSHIVWEKFRAKIGMYEPLRIHFPQYTREEFAQILLFYKPPDQEEAFYRNYLNLFLSVYYRFCRDLNELRYMAKLNFSKYIEPIESNQVKKDDISALWRNISNTFKDNLEVIYLRVSANDFLERNQLSREIESTTKLALSFELPYYAKYLLIAAYLASYNPAKEDRRLFMKQKSHTRKKVSKRPATVNPYTGPRNFPISRMLAIFCAILDEKVDINANLLAQIPSMCQLGLMTVVGNANLDEPKFKCCVSRDFITVIAKTVAFSLQNYLYDVSH